MNSLIPLLNLASAGVNTSLFAYNTDYWWAAGGAVFCFGAALLQQMMMISERGGEDEV